MNPFNIDYNKLSPAQKFASWITQPINTLASAVAPTAIQLGKDILRAPVRAAASFALSARGENAFLPGTGVAPGVEKFLLGNEPVYDVRTTGERSAEGIGRLFGQTPAEAKKNASILGLPFGLALMGLDALPMTPGGAGKKAVGKAAGKVAGEVAETTLKGVGKKVAETGLSKSIPGAIDDAIVASMKELRSEISEVRYGKLGNLEFDFRGTTYRAPEPTDILPVGNTDASRSWALRQILDKAATPVTGTKSAKLAADGDWLLKKLDDMKAAVSKDIPGGYKTTGAEYRPSEKTLKLMLDNYALENDLPTFADNLAAPAGKAIPAADDILSKAAKYPTPEEFVKAQGLNGFDFTTTGNKLWDNLIKSGKATVIKMSPDEFLDTRPPLSDAMRKLGFEDINPKTDKRVQYFVKKLQNGERLDTLLIDNENKWYDGIHRALAAKEVGINEIPVAVTDVTKYPNTTILKTRSQLTDIWNQAQKGVKTAATEALPTPQQTLQRVAEPALPKSTQLPPPDMPSISSIVKNGELDVKSKVNILDYFRTPEQVLERVGLGKQAQALRQGWDAYKADLKVQFDYLSSLSKKAPGEESSKRIFQYLDGQKVVLPQNELEVAEQLKQYLSGWADKLGLPQDRRIASYITHIFEPDFIKKEFDPELAKIIADKIPGAVYDPFLLKRLGKKGYVEDVWRAMDAYVKRASRKVNMDPALQMLKKEGKSLDLETFNYVKRLADRINMRPQEVENLIDNAIKSSPVGYRLGQRPTTALTKAWRLAIYRGGLGLNIGSAVRNLTQGANTYAKLGERYTVAGYIDLFRRWGSDGLEELYRTGILEDRFVDDRSISVIKKMSQRFDEGLFTFFDAAEKINRGAAYFGAKRQALDKGMSELAAVEFGKRVVRDTQFIFGALDTPIALSSDIAKTVAQFQTFNIKQMEFLGQMAKDKNFLGLFRWLGSSLALMYGVGTALGMSPADIIPSIRIGGSPLGTILGGTAKQLSPSEQKRQEGINDIKRTGTMLIPAGSQIRKSFEGLQTVGQGKSTTPTGRTRYTVEQTPGNYIRAGLFGTRSLPESQRYYNKATQPQNVGSTSPFSKYR